MSEVLDIKAAKATLRREVLVRRATLTAEQTAAYSQRITRRALSLPLLIEAEAVLLFASFGSELDTRQLIRACLDAGQDVVLPRVVWHPRRLDLYAITDPARDLEPGPWGIPQPMPGRCQEAMPRDLDFVFTPGVAFDVEGNRLGYGGGFYDSLLSQVRRELRGEGVAGLAFELQLVPEVPHKPKDMPVPLIITEERTIETAAHIPTSRGL